MLKDLNLVRIKTREVCEQHTEDAEELSCGCEEDEQEIDDFAVFRKGEALSDADIVEVRSSLEIIAQNVSFARGERPQHTPAATQAHNEPITTSGSQIGATFEG
jgi:hypothetical protein